MKFGNCSFTDFKKISHQMMIKSLSTPPPRKIATMHMWYEWPKHVSQYII